MSSIPVNAQRTRRYLKQMHRKRMQNFDKNELKKIKFSDFKFLMPFIKKNINKIILAIIWTIIGGIIALIPPILLKTIIDESIPSQNTSDIITKSILLIIIYLVLYFATFLRNMIMTKTAQSIIYELRSFTYKRFLSLSMNYYEDKKKGELISVVINDINILSNAITSGILNLLADLISLIGIMSIMFVLDWKLSIITFMLIPMIMLSVRKYRKRLKKTQFKIREKIADISANVEENISGIREAQSLTVEERNIAQFSELTTDSYRLRMKSTSIFATMNALISLNTYFGLAILLGIGGVRYMLGGISIGLLIAYLQYSTQFIRPMWDIANISNVFLEAGAALLHINQYIDAPILVKDPEEPVEIRSISNLEDIGTIELKNVYFSYDSYKENFGINEISEYNSFISDLNLKISAKEKIGIVGKTGAGKSTLIKLITRLYDVNKGEILLGGINIKKFRQKDLHSIIGLVSQDVFLFNGTIIDNIRFGRPTASEEEVIEAAKLAQCHEFIKNLPNGYNTKLGEHGSGLSGGQKQLIAYARLILSQPLIAILDEATSNIDSYTESKIQENMRNLLKDCTTIVIAHRFATLKAVDRIILIDDGKIIDSGSHDQLYTQNSYYKRLFDEQYAHN